MINNFCYNELNCVWHGSRLFTGHTVPFSEVSAVLPALPSRHSLASTFAFVGEVNVDTKNGGPSTLQQSGTSI